MDTPKIATINFEQIRKHFPLKNPKKFTFYIENIFKDLTTMQNNKKLGMSKLKFFDFIKLPIFICEKMFSAMDLDKDGYLSCDELTEPLLKLYFGTFEETAEFIFNLYDFDKDGLINSDDIKLILSYLPLKYEKTQIVYNHQLESLSELDEIIKRTFKNNQKMNLEKFIKRIQVDSDIYLQLLCYLYQKCNFKEKNVNMIYSLSSKNLDKLINLDSSNLSTKSTKSINKSNDKSSSEVDLEPTIRHSADNVVLKSPAQNSNFSPVHEFMEKFDPDNPDNNISKKQHKFGKNKNDSFNDLNSAEVSGYKGVKHVNPKFFISNQKTESKSHFSSLIDKRRCSVESIGDKIQNLEIIDFPEDNNSFDSADKEYGESISFEGMLYHKKLKGDIKPYWIVLINQDIHYYTDETKQNFVKMHNISGSFIKANGEIAHNGDKFFSFSIISSTKERTFFARDREYAKEWAAHLKKAMGYMNFFDYYEMLEDLGEGAYGMVKLGVQKSTNIKVAIKIITKSKLKLSQIEQLTNEIDIMKVCKHPNIVQFIDHFENSEYIFIVMEYIPYGDLKNHLLTYKYDELTEKKLSEITFQIASALKYLHFYGIIHRDLKPENILVASSDKNSILVKVMDFGFAKIVAPTEKANEGYGTLCYVAPEIILRTPYNNSVDIWSLGIILFYLSSGEFPFDSTVSNKEIAKKICYTPLKFNTKIWLKRSSELKDIIKGCLEKDMKKRFTIDQVFSHDFIKLYNKVE